MEQFFCKTRIFAGSGAVDALGQLGISRLFLVCDPFFARNGQARAVVAASNCTENLIFSDIKPDPPVTLAAQGAAEIRKFQPDAVVALGGGSAMDGAKAMLYFSECPARLIAIPTTSGSGSEVTDFAILTHDQVKHPLIDERIRPDVAILDSDFVSALPGPLIADGGFDLISHAIEAYVSPKAGTVSDLFARQALEVALAQLKASQDGDMTARAAVHTAATLAGIAFSQAGLGLCHALSHSLGGEFHVAHGRLNAILLPAVMEANATAGCPHYARLSRAMGLSGNDAMAFRGLKSTLLRLRRNLGLPEALAQAGISPTALAEKADGIISAALADPCCATNPVPADRAMVRRILQAVTGNG